MTIDHTIREFEIDQTHCYSCRDCSDQHPEAFMRVFSVIAPLGLEGRPTADYIAQVESCCPYSAIRYQER